MEKFYKKMRKDNKQNKIWMIMWIIAVCSFVLELNSNRGIELLIFVTLLSLSTYEYLTKYFFLYREGKYQFERFKFLVFLNSIKYSNLSEILRQHAFSLKEYMGILIRNFVPVQVVTVIGAIAYECLYYLGSGEIITIYAIVKIMSIVIIPFLVVGLFYLTKRKELTSDISKTNKFLFVFGDKILQLIKIGLTMVFCAEVVLIGYAVVISKLILSASEDNKWKFAIVYTHEFAVALIVLVGLLVFLSISRYRTTTLRVFLGFLTMAMLMAMIVFMFKKNIIVDNGGITVTMKYKSIHYGYRDVDYYKEYVSEDSSTLQPAYVYMLYMKNGRKVKIDFNEILSEDNIEENGQITDEANEEKIRKIFVKTLEDKKIPKRQ
ncbi:MAG TPA: hypothetical protein DCW44_03835 [Eubacterium sp.]|nr:hypothetical protein [Eubacterium sp.]